MAIRIPYQSEWKEAQQNGNVRLILRETDTFEIIINGNSLELPFVKELALGKDAKLSIFIQLAPTGNWDNKPEVSN